MWQRRVRQTQAVLPPVRTPFFLARFELFWPLCGPALLAEVDEAVGRNQQRAASWLLLRADVAAARQRPDTKLLELLNAAAAAGCPSEEGEGCSAAVTMWRHIDVMSWLQAEGPLSERTESE